MQLITYSLIVILGYYIGLFTKKEMSVLALILVLAVFVTDELKERRAK